MFLLKILRRIRFLRLTLKRNLRFYEYNLLYGDKIAIQEKYFFEEYFKIFSDNSEFHIRLEKGVFFRDYCQVTVLNNAKLILHEGVFFNHGCSINALEEIEIGENSIFGENAKIYDHNHKYNDGGIIKEQGYTAAKVKIGKNCWIGSNVIILKGVTINDNCVIGAGCVIHKSIDANTIVKSNTNLSINEIK